MRVSRRLTPIRLLIAFCCCLLVAGYASACASETSPSSQAESSPGFPVVIQHGQGTVTIPAKPSRVVAVGSADAQIASALGAQLVAVVKNPSSPDGNWPGMPKLNPSVLTLDNVTPELERIAAAQPDLILATSAQPEYGALYDKLSEIAPVVSYQRGLMLDSGEDLTRLIGKALGAEAEAAKLIEESAQRIRRFAEEHPELAGRTYAFGQYSSGSLRLILADDTPATRFMSSLGLRVPDELKRLVDPANNQFGMTTIAPELLSTLDSADVAFISAYGEGAEQEFTSNPLVAGLRLAATGQLRIISVDLAGALLAPNPAITPYLLDTLGPMLR